MINLKSELKKNITYQHTASKHKDIFIFYQSYLLFLIEMAFILLKAGKKNIEMLLISVIIIRYVFIIKVLHKL